MTVAANQGERAGVWLRMRHIGGSAFMQRALLWLWPPVAAILSLLLFIQFAPQATERMVEEAEGHAPPLQLKTLIRQVKKELQDADREAIANGEASLFKLQDFELDVNIVAKATANREIEIVALGGASAEVSRERAQRIHLKWVADSDAVTVQTEQGAISEAATDILEAEVR